MATSTKYLLLNGSYHIEASNIFNLYNRALSHGDCICETIHTCADRLCFFDEHMAHLRQGMKLAQMQIPEKFNNIGDVYYNEVSKLMSKNRVFKSANATIMVYRAASTQQYSADRIEYLVCETPFNYLGYELNETGIKLDIYDKEPKYCGAFANYETHNETLTRSIIRKTCLSRHLNDMIMTTHDGHVSEAAMGGNVFLICGNKLMTPPLCDGCIDDVFRRKVMEAARELGMETQCNEHIGMADMDRCSEIFLASTAYGIRWVSAYRTHRYIKQKVQAIHAKVNEKYLAERIDTENS